MDCSLPDSSVHVILQARILEWVAVSFSKINSTSIKKNFKEKKECGILFKINLYRSVFAVQCCVSFLCIFKVNHLHVYIYIPSFMDFLPIQVTTENWVEFSVLYSRFSLVIYFIHSSKTLAPWKKNYDQPRQHIKKQRHYFADKGPSSQSNGFSSIHKWMCELDYKESWVQKNWCF